jgi:hypothetical protein
MRKHQATGGALTTIMMSSGVIADFDLHEFGSELFVRVCVPQNCDGQHLQKQVAALLPSHVEERHVTIVEW